MSTPFHVLIIDDSDEAVLQIEKNLRDQWPTLVLEQVANEEGVQTALSNRSWDCVLCELHLPKFGAKKALKLLKKSGHDLPFIIISGVVNFEDVIALLKTGAHEFIRKDNLPRLVPAIKRVLDEVRNTQLRVEAERKLQESERLLNQAQVVALLGH